MPAVSVVMPAYNAERYIAAALDSALAQTCRDLEVVVVDDGSADSTRQIVAGYGPPVRLVEQANAGPSAARNHGVREAGGQFVAFLDSDDLWLPEKLAEQMALFDDGRRVGLVYCHADRIDADGALVPTEHAVLPKGQIFLTLLERNYCCTSSVVVRREALERAGGFPEDMVWAEDWHLWLRVARHYELQAVERALVRHRVHGTSLTWQLEGAYHGARKVLDDTVRPDDGPQVRRAARRGTHRLDRNYGLQWLGMADLARARRALCRALRNRPSDLHAAVGIAASLLPAVLRIPLLRLWKRVCPWMPWEKDGRCGQCERTANPARRGDACVAPTPGIRRSS